jgi:hypothetical protein
MHIVKSAYVHDCKCKIHSDTFRYAQNNMCISECIQTKNTIRYKQICTSTLVHMCRYVDLKYIQIQADMHFYTGAYLTVSCCMRTAFSKHTYTYACYTAHKITQYIQIHAHTFRYMYVHITYALCILDMHMDVCRAYPCLYVFVLILHTYHIKQCI